MIKYGHFSQGSARNIKQLLDIIMRIQRIFPSCGFRDTSMLPNGSNQMLSILI